MVCCTVRFVPFETILITNLIKRPKVKVIYNSLWYSLAIGESGMPGCIMVIIINIYGEYHLWEIFLENLCHFGQFLGEGSLAIRLLP